MSWRMRELGVTLCAALIAVAAQAGPYDRGLLWRIDKPGTAPSYVFGTLHSSDPRVTTLAPQVTQAFARCRTFAAEIYLSYVADARFFEAMQFEDGRRLEPLLGEDGYARLKSALGETAPTEDILARTKPWAALLRVTAPQPPAEGATLDAELLAGAQMRRMAVFGLEGLDEQIAALDDIPLDTQLALLRHAIDDPANLAAQLEPTIQAWLRRDLAALARVNRAEGGDPELARHYAVLTRRIVDNRSVLMAHRLFLPLRAGKVFVAVGALHLYGEQGLLALLKQQGYQVRRVY